MQGAFILAGRVDELNIVVAPYVADNTLMVSQRTFDRIKHAFPEASHDINESVPQQTTGTPCCPNCGLYLLMHHVCPSDSSV